MAWKHGGNTMDPEDYDTSDDTEWPPSRFRILCAMRARRMAGVMTSADVARMDEGPPETWPRDLWELVGFSPPSYYEEESSTFWNPSYTDENQLVIDLPENPHAHSAQCRNSQ